jgi:hypothetical protein
VPLLQATRKGNFAVDFVLDIAGWSDLMDTIRSETGVSPESVGISVAANVHTTGKTEFGPVDLTFSPVMKGTIKGNILQWDKELTTSLPGSMKKTGPVPPPLRMLGLSISTFKIMAAVLLVFFAFLTGFLLFQYLRPSGPSASPAVREVAEIRKKWGVRIAEGTAGSSPWGANVITVASIQDLVKVSDELSKPVVHQAPTDRYGDHVYYIVDGNTRYQYLVREPIT